MGTRASAIVNDLNDFLEAGGADTLKDIADEFLDEATDNVEDAAKDEVDVKADEAMKKAGIAFALLVVLILATRK